LQYVKNKGAPLKLELSIALPAYNEEANVKEVISSIKDRLINYVENFEIIVVNDGSTDTTLDILNGIRSVHPELNIISHDYNMGYGSALRTCIKCARGEWIFFMDADGQFTMKDFYTFWMKRSEYDFILGYRKNRQDGCYRLLLGRFGNTISNLLLGKRIKDINCGFKLVKKALLQNASFLSTGGLIYFEMLFHLFKKRRKFTQLPVQHFERKEGSSTGGNGRVIMRIITEGLRYFYIRLKPM